MSTMEQIRKAVEVANGESLGLMHCTSAYPCEPDELNLRMVETLRHEFPTFRSGIPATKWDWSLRRRSGIRGLPGGTSPDVGPRHVG
jgi:hypothetical protein